MGHGALRFVTDNDVDALVAVMLRDKGHDAWTAAAAGIPGVSDPSLAVYADDKEAALVTHDREFSKWRQNKMFGRHIWIRVAQPDAAEVLEEHLEDLIPILHHRPHVQIEVRRESFEVHKPRWHD